MPGWPGDKKIVVLAAPPRGGADGGRPGRVGTRAAGSAREVGYQIRFDDQTSLGTRISYVTEGILLRWLQDDRTLSDVGVVIFDEFHERNLLSDVALALVKRLQRTERPDLKMAVMSATLEAEPVAEYLAGEAGTGETPVLHSEGQSFPVEVRYLSQHDERPVTEQAADVVEQIVNSGEPGRHPGLHARHGRDQRHHRRGPGHPRERAARLDPLARRLAARAAGPRLRAQPAAQGGRRHQRRRDLGHH